MLMTSSSLAETPTHRLVWGFLILLLLTSATNKAQDLAPDSPRPARPVVKPTRPSVVQDVRSPSVELRSVTVRRPSANQRKLAGENFLRTATEPLVIEVRTMRPLGNLTRTSSPVIVLNGKQLSETIPVAADRLVAFLPDRKMIRRTNTVVVEWLGDERLTRSKRPLVFSSRDVNR